jgi:hypothetical protein
MRLNSTILFLLAAALLLAKSEGGPGKQVDVRCANSRVEITGSDSDRVQVDDNSHATVRNTDRPAVVEIEGSGEGQPLILQVPRGASLDVATSNGGIRVSGVAGSMRLTTSNGEITVQAAGTSAIRAHSSNGKIEVELPRGLNANLSRARATAASIPTSRSSPATWARITWKARSAMAVRGLICRRPMDRST